MAELTRLREDSNLLDAEWSRWEKAMVPPNAGGGNLELRASPHVGYICSSIRNAFPVQAQRCGIYEWRATKKTRGQAADHHVVYVGSTCRNKPGALRDRILEYCRNGSHKGDLINDTLSRGYELWVRVKIARQCDLFDRCKRNAEDMENKLLSQYNYAWNIRNNGVRKILP